MLNFLATDTFYNKLMIASLMGCAVVIYQLNKKKKKYKGEIKKLSNAKIYEF